MAFIEHKYGSTGRFTPYFFVLPAGLLVLLLILYPISQTFIMSVTNWNLVKSADGHYFLGLDNYRSVVESSNFWSSLWLTVSYTFFSVSGKIAVGLGVALLLNGNIRGRGLFRALVVVPWALPSVVATLVWVLSMDPYYGIINVTLLKLGLIDSAVPFLSHPDMAFASVIMVNIWKQFPFVAVMLLAGLQAIPEELEEAAMIDGSNAVQSFFYISLPLLLPVLNTVILLQIIWTMREFTLVYLIAKGGPGTATSIMSIDIYQNAFHFFKMGVAAAEGVILLCISIVFVVAYRFALRRSSGE